MTISFSIILPNYNSPYLERAVSSVIKQTYNKWELIIIDNFSNNSPDKLINKFKDERIKFYKFDNKNNIARARNYGIEKSNYHWIAFLDADDVWKKNKIEKVKQIIERQNSDFVYHGMYYLPKKFGFIDHKIKDQSKEISKPIYETLIKEGNAIANSSVVVKKKILEEINFLSEDNKKFSWEDYDCWIRCSKKTDSFSYIPTILGYCWIGGGNISNLDQTYINYKHFHEIYHDQILRLTNKKRLDWYNNFLLIWYFKKKKFNRAYIMQKNIKPKDLKSFLRSLLIKVIFLTKILKKKLVFK